MVIETLSRLPESVSLSEILEESRILAAIKEGQRAADAGELVPHEEAVKLVESWATKYAGQSQR